MNRMEFETYGPDHQACREDALRQIFAFRKEDFNPEADTLHMVITPYLGTMAEGTSWWQARITHEWWT